MNELFDKLILRIIFTLFICIILFLYKYVHYFLYPSARKQILKKFFPQKNAADSIHFFCRILGMGILFSEFFFNISDGIFIAMFDFFIEAFIVSIFYISSLYIIESIVLYSFEYKDEILKRKNLSYAVICCSHAISVAFLLKNIVFVVKDSLIMLFFLWLFVLVLLGFATKTFAFFSKLSFNKLVIQKDIGIALSYTGFIFGWSYLISSATHHELSDLKWYSLQVILKIVLSLIIFPIFKKGIVFVFQIQEEFDESELNENNEQYKSIVLGRGIYEGVIFFTSCYLTTVITGHINFGTFYPVY